MAVLFNAVNIDNLSEAAPRLPDEGGIDPK